VRGAMRAAAVSFSVLLQPPVLLSKATGSNRTMASVALNMSNGNAAAEQQPCRAESETQGQHPTTAPAEEAQERSSSTTAATAAAAGAAVPLLLTAIIDAVMPRCCCCVWEPMGHVHLDKI